MGLVQIICEIVTALSTVLIVIQLLIMRNTEKKNREEARRLNTVQVMQHWSDSLEKETSFAERIVEQFDKEQCRKLYAKDNLIVNEKLAGEIMQLCPLHADDCEQQSENQFLIKGALLSELRWYIITYLNTLETVLTAWNLSIVDHETIVSQFQYLYNQEKDWNVLEEFRNASGGNKSYPSTTFRSIGNINYI